MPLMYGGDWLFWVAAVAMTGMVLAVVLRAFWIRHDADRAVDADTAVYRAQLREVEKDRARGTLAPEEAEAARAEVARRLLAADAARSGPAAGSRGAAMVGAGAVAAVVVAVAAWTYAGVGAPGYGDLPLAGRIAAVEAARAGRPTQAVAEAEIPARPVPENADPQVVAMVERLRGVLADRPDDLEGWRLAARVEAGLEQYANAWRAQDRVVALLGPEATGDDFVALAEAMILSANGYVSPEAEQALAEAARRDPTNGLGRYYAGLMYAQGGRYDLAWRIWRNLVAQSAPGDPWLDPIYAQAERVSSLAGDPTPLDDLPRPVGPSQDQVAAAATMTPGERVEMIGGMVSSLAERLATEGGPPSDWARLVTAYGVLGRRDAAAAVYAEARLVFEDDPAAIDTLGRAAEQAGLSPE